MASRHLRSRKQEEVADRQATEFSRSPFSFSDPAPEELAGVGERVVSGESVHNPLGEQLASTSSEVAGEVGAGESEGSGQVVEPRPQADFLSAIWQQMQMKYKADAEYRLREKEDRKKEREEDRKRLELVREDIAKTTELIKAQFRAELDAYNDRILGKLEKETNKLSESIRSLRQNSQQKIEAVNGRVDAVVECLNDKFVEVSNCMSEKIVEANACTDEKLAKLTENVNGKLNNVITEQRQLKEQIIKEAESNAREFVVNELSSFQSRVAEEAHVKVREIIALSDRNNIAKIDELTSRVNWLQGRLAVNDCTQTRPTADCGRS
jgi:hypothetical protein